MFVALIPTYNRSKMLKFVLSSLDKHSEFIKSVIVLVQASTLTEGYRYEEVLREFRSHSSIEVVDIMFKKPIGSAKARRLLLKYAYELYGAKNFGVMLEDDLILPSNSEIFKYVIRDFNLSQHVCGVIGRVINIGRRRVDPDICLSSPTLADSLTEVTGYIFISCEQGLRLASFGSAFMAFKLSIVGEGVNYDPHYGGTGFREESDFQMQIVKRGCFLIYDSRFFAYHVNLMSGGNRGINDLFKRMYWKARNHAYFIKKHFNGLKGFVYLFEGGIILVVYGGLVVLPLILKGLRDGLMQLSRL